MNTKSLWDRLNPEHQEKLNIALKEYPYAINSLLVDLEKITDIGKLTLERYYTLTLHLDIDDSWMNQLKETFNN